MANQLVCECGSESFQVNGWMVTDGMVGDPEDADTPGQTAMRRAYDEGDVGKADVVELVCADCGAAIPHVDGGRL